MQEFYRKMHCKITYNAFFLFIHYVIEHIFAYSIL